MRHPRFIGYSRLCGLSLLIFLLAMGIWVRGISANERIGWMVAWRHSTKQPISRCITYGIEWSRGTVCFSRNGSDSDLRPEQMKRWEYSHFEPRSSFIQPRRPIDRLNFQFGGFQL